MTWPPALAARHFTPCRARTYLRCSLAVHGAPVIRLDTRAHLQAVPHVVDHQVGISFREQKRAISWKHLDLSPARRR